jgi:hypothetical protein
VNSKVRRTIPIAVVVLAVPALALAASPKKGATYVGQKGGGATSLVKKVSVRVGESGKTARAFLYCGTGRASNQTPRFKIKNGRFTATKKVGSVLVWSLTHGKFTSSTKAKAYLNVNSVCDGRSDGNITLTLKTTPK